MKGWSCYLLTADRPLLKGSTRQLASILAHANSIYMNQSWAHANFMPRYLTKVYHAQNQSWYLGRKSHFNTNSYSSLILWRKTLSCAKISGWTWKSFGTQKMLERFPKYHLFFSSSSSSWVSEWGNQNVPTCHAHFILLLNEQSWPAKTCPAGTTHHHHHQHHQCHLSWWGERESCSGGW